MGLRRDGRALAQGASVQASKASMPAALISSSSAVVPGVLSFTVPASQSTEVWRLPTALMRHVTGIPSLVGGDRSRSVH
ncbi:MAG: hypothetical protein VXZ59_07760 [Cyanobacteriota bacterium]|nr:hypothetical protein [Cyanobacteriota bacterium]